MLNKIDYKKLGWASLCDKGCYHPYDHSHDFELGKNIEKNCPHCQQKMEIDAQIYGCALGENVAELYNTYKCTCGYPDKNVLYKGQPKGYSEIYEAAKRSM